MGKRESYKTTHLQLLLRIFYDPRRFRCLDFPWRARDSRQTQRMCENRSERNHRERNSLDSDRSRSCWSRRDSRQALVANAYRSTRCRERQRSFNFPFISLLLSLHFNHFKLKTRQCARMSSVSSDSDCVSSTCLSTLSLCADPPLSPVFLSSRSPLLPPQRTP